MGSCTWIACATFRRSPTSRSGSAMPSESGSPPISVPGIPVSARGPDACRETGSSADAGSAAPVLALVRDLFFVARIRETARLAGVALRFARSVEELRSVLAPAPRFALVDLTAGLDYDAIFAALASAGVPALGFTTHALARETQPWHARCARVVTKETL